MSRQFAPFPQPQPGVAGLDYQTVSPASRTRQQAMADSGFLDIETAAASINRSALAVARVLAPGYCPATFMPDNDGRPPLTGKFVLLKQDWGQYVSAGLFGIVAPSSFNANWYSEPRYYDSDFFWQTTLPNAAEQFDLPTPSEVIRQVGDRGGPLSDRPVQLKFASDRGIRQALSNRSTAAGTDGAVFLGTVIRNLTFRGVQNSKYGSGFGVSAAAWLFGFPGRPENVMEAVLKELRPTCAITVNKTYVKPSPARYDGPLPAELAKTVSVTFARTWGEIIDLLDADEVKRLAF